MKRLVLALLALLALSCSEFDDSAIWDKLNNHETRIGELERICKEMNADIIKLQTLVTALENKDYIVSAAPLAAEDGYAFVFKSGKSVVIYNGKDGADGKDGVDGKDGAEGVTPQIGVRQDADGFFYWTVNGEWLLVDGVKVRASASDGVNGSDGKDGEDGKDAITPKFKIEADNWYVSYDNGQTWELLGRATGDDAFAGANGESIFKRAYIEEGYACFEINDETNMILRIPLQLNGALTITLENEGTLLNNLSSEQITATTSLILKGKVNHDDMRAIQLMPNLQSLDLSGADFVKVDNGYGGFRLNPYQDTLINKSISELVLPKFTQQIYSDFSYCIALRRVVVTSDFTHLYNAPESYDDEYKPITFIPNLEEVEYAEGVTRLETSGLGGRISRIIYPSTFKYIPLSLTTDVKHVLEKLTNSYTYYYTITLDTFVCKALVPPVIEDSSYTYDYDNKWYKEYVSTTKKYYYHKVNPISDAVLYVPRESIEAYRAAPLWDSFTNILPLEDIKE